MNEWKITGPERGGGWFHHWIQTPRRVFSRYREIWDTGLNITLKHWRLIEMMLLVFLTSISTLPRTPELRIYEVRPAIVQFAIGYLGKDGMSLMTICEKHSWLEGMCIRNLVYDRKDIRYTAKTTHYWTKIAWTCWQQSWIWCQKGVKDTSSWRRTAPCLSRLVLAPLADLGLETTLDSVNRSSTAARFASHEEDTVFFCE